ncbi:hypothetical protein BaRGS_00028808 [Batillaria attramentaria]|uniref:PH domain-containing protein n=1 Tax=Batillaria attramentaria TaxID=370345 RepID=A0ABD0JYX3_9CAEN
MNLSESQLTFSTEMAAWIKALKLFSGALNPFEKGETTHIYSSLRALPVIEKAGCYVLVYFKKARFIRPAEQEQTDKHKKPLPQPPGEIPPSQQNFSSTREGVACQTWGAAPSGSMEALLTSDRQGTASRLHARSRAENGSRRGC